MMTPALITGLALLTSPSPQPAAPAPAEVPVSNPFEASDEQMKVVVDGSSRFALRLLGQTPANQNAVFSPYSLSIALTMTHAGAAGETAAEMAGMLGLGGIESPRSDAAWSLVGRKIQEQATAWGPRAYAFNAANRLWAANDLNVREEFAAVLKRYYSASVGKIDPSKKDESAAAINAWVKEQTRGLVPSIVDPSHITSQGLVLTNTIYFNGRWAETFGKAGTKPEPFTLSVGEPADVPMMRQTEDFGYAEGAIKGPDGKVPLQIVSMSYNGGAEAILVLPREAGAMSALVAGLAAEGGFEQLDGLLSGVSSREVRLMMPKFTIQSKRSVADSLKHLGVGRAFTDKAQFPLMSDTELMIADVLHAAKIIVDEEGTEAAAATAVVMAPTSAPFREKPEPVEFKADRPFLMIIRDRATRAWLFVTRVEDPRGGSQ